MVLYLFFGLLYLIIIYDHHVFVVQVDSEGMMSDSRTRTSVGLRRYVSEYRKRISESQGKLGNSGGYGPLSTDQPQDFWVPSRTNPSNI